MGVSKPTHFVLVHGGGLGAWCWYKIVDMLRKNGHKATAIDLASCGRDHQDPNTLTSFLDYNQPLADFLESLPANEKVSIISNSLHKIKNSRALSSSRVETEWTEFPVHSTQ